MIYFLIAIAILALIGFLIFRKKDKPQFQFTIDIHKFLLENVLFYSKLNAKNQKNFIERVQLFLGKIKISGIGTDITEEDKALVAAAAIIPIFNFKKWFYPNLKEVIIYPTGFDQNFELGTDKPVLGMVGNMFLNGKMLLSKRSLHAGFNNKTDKRNTAIHEFVHLIDMADGATDGIPELFLCEKNILPWLDLMYFKINEIKEGKSDIDYYGATSEVEFFTVAAEYFFERPNLFKRKHPKLFKMMNDVFGAKS